MEVCLEGIKAVQSNESGKGSSTDSCGAHGDEGEGVDKLEVQNFGYVPSCSGSALQRVAQCI